MQENNSLEQLRKEAERIEILREETEIKLGSLFDDKQKLGDRTERFILRLEAFEKGGLVFNRAGITKGLRESLSIKDRDVFIAHLMKVLEPLIVLRVKQPKIFEKIERDVVINNGDTFKLSEVLYVDFENEIVRIHLAPASELIKEGGITSFKKEIVSGLKKLAEIVKSDEKIKEIWATSWIVAKNPLILERLGFTVVGEISEEERREHFLDEKRPVAKAFMTRKDFLAKYGN